MGLGYCADPANETLVGEYGLSITFPDLPTEGRRHTREEIAKLVEAARRAEARGFPSFWTPNIFGLEAITALAIAARETRSIELGTAVVPTSPRHPVAMALVSFLVGVE